MEFEKLTLKEEEIRKAIVNAAFKVHSELGPGLLEKIYEVCSVHELRKEGLQVARQLDVPIQYDGITFDEGLRLDVLIENKVIIEIKAVDLVNPVWQAQVLSHLKLTKLRLGYPLISTYLESKKELKDLSFNENENLVSLCLCGLRKKQN